MSSESAVHHQLPRALVDAVDSNFVKPAGPRNANWIWYFVLLFVLVATSLTILIVYNLRQQLTAEQLSAARLLWEQKGPRDYDMQYTQEVGALEHFEVKVRNGSVISATRDGKPIEPRQLNDHSMLALFGFIEGFLKCDAAPGRPRTYTVANFSKEDGQLFRYVRRVSGTTERVEIIVQKLTPHLPADADKTDASRSPGFRRINGRIYVEWFGNRM